MKHDRLSTGWVLLLILVSGCGQLQNNQEPDEQFGHRFGERSPDGRETVLITSPVDTTQQYDIYPALFDSVHVRVAPVGPGQTNPVEVLVKGAFPDGCMQLHALNQVRAGNIINVDLMMRRPKEAICTQVVRPYRFYFELEGTFPMGAYTLKINEKAYPFSVRS
jgi:hypothetical protein